MTAEEYFAKSDAFISDYRWANGTSWGSGQRPKISDYESYGCYAYGVDFARYMYNVARTYTEGEVYYSASQIRTGDVIRIDWGSSQHTVVVLERKGTTLRTAEGNINGKVRVSDAGYTISGNGVIASWGQYASFRHGYHFNTGGAATREEVFVPNPTWRNGTVTRVPSGVTYLLIPVCAPNMGVSRCYASYENGTRLNIWPTVAENESWQFRFTAQTDGTYGIQAGDTGKYLHVDLNAGTRGNGARVVLWDGYGSDNSSWWVEDNGDGTYSFRNRGTDRYFDVTGGLNEMGTMIEQWEGNSTNAQKFRLVEVKENYSGGSDDADYPFTDVNGLTPHVEDIVWLQEQGVTEGYPDGSFGGELPILRQDMAAFLYRMAGSPDYEPTDEERTAFDDVDENTPHAKEIWWCASQGIATGWQSYYGSVFKGEELVLRQDMSAFLYRLATYLGSNMTVQASYNNAFTDVDFSTPHYDSIMWLASTGISEGYPDGSFGGGLPILRQDMAAFLHRLSSVAQGTR